MYILQLKSIITLFILWIYETSNRGFVVCATVFFLFFFTMQFIKHWFQSAWSLHVSAKWQRNLRFYPFRGYREDVALECIKIIDLWQQNNRAIWQGILSWLHFCFLMKKRKGLCFEVLFLYFSRWEKNFLGLLHESSILEKSKREREKKISFVFLYSVHTMPGILLIQYYY